MYLDAVYVLHLHDNNGLVLTVIQEQQKENNLFLNWKKMLFGWDSCYQKRVLLFDKNSIA